MEQMMLDTANVYNRIDALYYALENIYANYERDIIQKQLLNKKLTSILQLMPIGIVMIDRDGIVIEANYATQKILEQDIIGQSWEHIVNTSFVCKDDDGCDISLYNGKKVSIALSNIQEHNVQIITITDLTHARMLQDELNREKRLSLLGSMLAALTHQIKTPIATVLLYLSNALLDSSKAKDKYIRKAQSSLNYLNYIVNNIVFFVRGKINETREMTASNLIDKIMKTLPDMLSSKKVEIIVCNMVRNLMVRVNSAAFTNAIANLINNSIQASQAQEKTEICIFFLTRELGFVEIIISDLGSGISEEIKDKIIDPYYTTKSTGTGLGLTISKSIIESLDGKFNIITQDTQGVKISIKLPLC